MAPIKSFADTLKNAVEARDRSALSLQQEQSTGTRGAIETLETLEDAEFVISGAPTSSVTSGRCLSGVVQNDRSSPKHEDSYTRHDAPADQGRKGLVMSPSGGFISPQPQVEDHYDEVLKRPRPTLAQQRSQRQQSKDWLNGGKFEVVLEENHWRWPGPSVKDATKPKAPKA
jgi:hypothetical protein